MALSRLSVNVGSKGKSSSHADYIQANPPYNKKAHEVEKKGFGNLPEWAKNNPSKFWEEADKNENKNGTAYREHLINLPRELNPEQRAELVNEWIEKQIGDKHAYTYAIHNVKATDGKDQPHLHLMFSERTHDEHQRTDPKHYFKRYNKKNPERGGCKKSNGDFTTAAARKEQLNNLRNDWEKLANEHLIKAGFEPSIDMRNYKERVKDDPTAKPPREYLDRATYQARQKLKNEYGYEVENKPKIKKPKHQLRVLRHHLSELKNINDDGKKEYEFSMGFSTIIEDEFYKKIQEGFLNMHRENYILYSKSEEPFISHDYTIDYDDEYNVIIPDDLTEEERGAYRALGEIGKSHHFEHHPAIIERINKRLNYQPNEPKSEPNEPNQTNENEPTPTHDSSRSSGMNM